jgi:endo-1,4-beta-xylanase
MKKAFDYAVKRIMSFIAICALLVGSLPLSVMADEAGDAPEYFLQWIPPSYAPRLASATRANSAAGNACIDFGNDPKAVFAGGADVKNTSYTKPEPPVDNSPSYSYRLASGYAPPSNSNIITEDQSSKLIASALEAGKPANINLDEDISTVYFSGKDLVSVASKGKDVNLVKDRFSCAFQPQLIYEWALQDKTSVVMMLRPVTAAIDNELASKAIEVDAINETLIKQVYAFDVRYNVLNVSSTAAPIKVAVDLSNWKLNDSQIAKLTGVAYDAGLKSYKQLGGEVSADGKTFVFCTFQIGTHGILISNALTKTRLAIGSHDIYKNGVKSATDVAPYISAEGRTMLPLRVISEALGATVSWSTLTRTVTVQKGAISLALVIGEPLPNGLGTPIIQGDRTFVPLRYIAQNLEANVVWHGDTRTVDIYQ